MVGKGEFFSGGAVVIGVCAFDLFSRTIVAAVIRVQMSWTFCGDCRSCLPGVVSALACPCRSGPLTPRRTIAQLPPEATTSPPRSLLTARASGSPSPPLPNPPAGVGGPPLRSSSPQLGAQASARSACLIRDGVPSVPCLPRSPCNGSPALPGSELPRRRPQLGPAGSPEGTHLTLVDQGVGNNGTIPALTFPLTIKPVVTLFVPLVGRRPASFLWTVQLCKRSAFPRSAAKRLVVGTFSSWQTQLQLFAAMLGTLCPQ